MASQPQLVPQGKFKDFDADLSLGKRGELEALGILQGTLEVKTDRMAYRTGNLFVEFECRGKPSGIAVTKASWWAFNILDNTKDIVAILLVETGRLKQACRMAFKENRIINGGDDMAARGILLPIRELTNERN